MILQYKGFNNNWCYEEADVITSAVVYVGEVTESYRNKKNEYKDEIRYADEVYKAVNSFIIKETCCEDNIAYHTGMLDQLGNVVVVTLNDKNKNITRVFDNGSVYLLNSNGQTVQRLA